METRSGKFQSRQGQSVIESILNFAWNANISKVNLTWAISYKYLD